jgi:antitoxin component of RelBE/YafQ-DinJ toxin-antitoxin module
MKVTKKCKLCLKYSGYNKDTLKAIEESRQGIDIKAFSSIEKMFKELNSNEEGI